MHGEGWGSVPGPGFPFPFTSEGKIGFALFAGCFGGGMLQHSALLTLKVFSAMPQYLVCSHGLCLFLDERQAVS